jgi:hypothetical protein
MPIPSNQDWRKYVPGLAGVAHDPSLKIKPVEWQTYDVQTSRGPFRTRSMLTMLEIALLYSVARDQYTGEGEIVDGGPLIGVGTRAMAQGLMENPRVTNKLQRIWSFDLWLAAGMGHYVEGMGGQTGSVFEDFLRLNEDYRPQIHASPGDLMNMTWRPKPIEILFIDISKSLELNAYVLKNWFTQLIPGKSIVLQQDYVYFDQWWIAVTMEYFKEHFELLGFVFGATAYYLCKQAVTAAEVAAFMALSPADHLALLDRAIAGAPPSVAQVLQCGKARMLMTHDRTAAAAALSEVQRDVHGSDPVSDFSGIAASNADVMAKLLA